MALIFACDLLPFNTVFVTHQTHGGWCGHPVLIRPALEDLGVVVNVFQNNSGIPRGSLLVD